MIDIFGALIVDTLIIVIGLCIAVAVKDIYKMLKEKPKQIKKRIEPFAHGSYTYGGEHIETTPISKRTQVKKLTEYQVLDIRKLKDKFSAAELGRNYGVSRQTIRNILKRKTWKHI